MNVTYVVLSLFSVSDVYMGGSSPAVKCSTPLFSIYFSVDGP